MLKRLNFLKSSLDGHSPKQTTTHMRLKNSKKRDNRVIEIWRKEMEAPTVPEILQSYLKNRRPVNIDLTVDNYEQRALSNLQSLNMSINLQSSFNAAAHSRNPEGSLMLSNGSAHAQPEDLTIALSSKRAHTNDPTHERGYHNNFEASTATNMNNPTNQSKITQNDSSFIT